MYIPNVKQYACVLNLKTGTYGTSAIVFDEEVILSKTQMQIISCYRSSGANAPEVRASNFECAIGDVTSNKCTIHFRNSSSLTCDLTCILEVTEWKKPTE